MNRKDLHPDLAKEYTVKRGYGVTKAGPAEYENVWFVVPPPPPRERPKKLPLKSLAQAHKALAKQKLLVEASDLDRTLSFLLLNREAVSSSRMEGTWSTIDHVLSPGDQLLDSDLRKSTESVRAYARGLNQHYERFAKKGVQAFTLSIIKSLHREIMRPIDPSGALAGQIRRPGRVGSIVAIGGLGRIENSIYNPAPPRQVSRSLKSVMEWLGDPEIVEIGDAGMGLTLPLRMALGHSHFEAVHPFTDGNGRVGRMLWPLQMVAAGLLPLYLSGYVEHQKREYYEALQLAQKKLNYSPLIEFVCEAIVASQAELEVTMNHLKEFPKKWKNRSGSRAGSGARRALDDLLDRPVFTINELKKRLGISFEAASKAASQLVSDGIVRERTGFGRNRVFAAEEVVHLLAREFGESPTIAETKARSLLKPTP